MTFLQISRSWEEEHSSDRSARFKCLGCHSTFGLTLPVKWNFCPNCGKPLEVRTQDIPRKQYYDNAGFHTTNKHGEWVHLKPPYFTLMMEMKVFLTDDEWEPMNMFPVTGWHDSIKRYVRNEREREHYRFWIIPSKPLNLP